MQTQPLVLRQRLIEAVDETYHVLDFTTIVQVLEILESLPVTKEVLEATRLGRTVNEFRRKVNDEQLAKRAKALVKKWRNEVLPEDPSAVTTQTKSTLHFNGNSHLVSEGPGPGPGPGLEDVPTTLVVKDEPEIDVPVQVEPEQPKRGRGRAKKRKLLTMEDKIADTTLELQAQLAKAEEAKYGRSLAQPLSVVPPKLSKLIAEEDQSISSPDSPASGAASGTLISNNSQVQPSPTVLSAQDQIIKNEIIEKYLKSQSELKSQMERQYQDRLARNEFEETTVVVDQEGDETSRSSFLNPTTNSNSNDESPSPSEDVTDAGTIKTTNKIVSTTTTAIQNGTKVSIKGKKKARLKDNVIEDSNEPIIPIFESEAEILAKLPPIDPEILATFSNYIFDVEPEPEELSDKSTLIQHNTTLINTNTIKTEKCLSSTLNKTSSFTPVASNINNSISTTITSTPNSNPTTHPISNNNKTIKIIKKIKLHEPKEKSLFDLSDEEDDEDEDDVEFTEVEEIIEEPTSPVPMEVSISSSSPLTTSLSSPTQLQAHENILSNNNDSNSTNLSNNDNNNVNTSSEAVQVNSQSTVVVSYKEDPQFVRVIEDSEVDDLLTKQIVGLNGNYDKTGSFREFHETILVETYRGEDFHILPYTIIDF